MVRLILAGIDESGAGGDGLVGGDAGHGHRVGGDPVREARPQGSLTRHIARFYFLNINKENSGVVLIFFSMIVAHLRTYCVPIRRVRRSSLGCGVAQLVVRRFAVRQARVRFSARGRFFPLS
jgi:hypothetical protein